VKADSVRAGVMIEQKAHHPIGVQRVVSEKPLTRPAQK
jgi:hypothetical protein